MKKGQYEQLGDGRNVVTDGSQSKGGDGYSLTYNSEDSDFATSIYKGGLALQGYVYTFMCVPFMCLGACGCPGPYVQVEQGQEATVLKYGKLSHIVGPGTYHRNIGTESYILRNIMIQTLDIPSQQVMTKDSVSVTLDAVCFYKVADLKKAIFSVGNAEQATLNLCQSVLEQLLGAKTLDELLSNRQMISEGLSDLICDQTSQWGIVVQSLEIRDIRVPFSIQRTMAAVAEAEREGEAKVVMAAAELRAADTYRNAARVMSRNPVALQLRYFQTLTEIAGDKHSTMIVPSETTNMFRPLHRWDDSPVDEESLRKKEKSNPEI